jgi:hypothetical protein
MERPCRCIYEVARHELKLSEAQSPNPNAATNGGAEKRFSAGMILDFCKIANALTEIANFRWVKAWGSRPIIR